jgi:hypothetical protein
VGFISFHASTFPEQGLFSQTNWSEGHDCSSDDKGRVWHYYQQISLFLMYRLLAAVAGTGKYHIYKHTLTSQESWAFELACALHEDCAQDSESAPTGEQQFELVLLWYGL